SDIMSRVYNFLGLTCGCILVGQTPAERREMYACDITYGTNNEFGFDYLRDNMAQVPEDMVQRGHAFVIVDEVDSILIDEARTPLIISGPADGDLNRWYVEFARIARLLKRDEDYEVDEKKKTVGILEPGIDKVEDQLGVENLYEAANTPLIGFLNNAIRAKELFFRDRDYIVDGGEVLIVDEHTGRVLPGRRYNDGMHQAIEAKEGVEIKSENQTLATITLQNYFRLYPEGSRSGMTGTAETEAAEFASTYKIDVVPIPTNKPMARKDQPDLVYPTEKGKLNAIIEDVVKRHEAGQPVLIGTASVEKSELLSQMLKKKHIPHQVLNAKQHAREAEVVAMAGRKGAVTVATNMAGRGTDIMLGGNSEFLAQANLAAEGLDPKENPEEYREAWPKALEAAEEAVEAEREEVRELGGLYVLGSERHESRRIDNQLRGRAGRQGDPGTTQFYLSLEDDLMRLFGGNRMDSISSMMEKTNMPDDQPIQASMVSKAIESAQRQVETMHFAARKNVLEYDDVMNLQRKVIYEERNSILDGKDMNGRIPGIISDAASAVVEENCPERAAFDDWDVKAVDTWAAGMTGNNDFHVASIEHDDEPENVADALTEYLEGIYAEKENLLGADMMRNLESQVMLRIIDTRWMAHLAEMDYLKTGIGLRAFAQRDPLVEYKNEAYAAFQRLTASMYEDYLRTLLRLQIAVKQEPIPEERNPLEGRLSYSKPEDVLTESDIKAAPAAAQATQAGEAPKPAAPKPTTYVKDKNDPFANVGRNDPCPCGSGKKFKKCHGMYQD
ncbi:preprotein translocase subunit SecA, partial [Ellagibacter isourolithinifaciens]|uniref:preprotein translocase subunit SecA n=1 Tax=Ellagibacter isourolithinifaciens TaxID=2137581 RepID=UPI003A937C3E